MPTYEALFQSLEARGWTVSDAALPQGLPQRLYDECQGLWQTGHFRPAMVGRNSWKARHEAIRGDQICWLEPGLAGPASHDFLAWIAGLRDALNQAFYLGLNSEEFHFARYPVGTGYKKHLDRHQGTAYRKVSVTLYLNPDWPQDGGGELCLYATADDTAPTDVVVPTVGRVALFLSDVIVHEVRPATQARWSLTGWLRTDAAGAV